MQGGRRVEMIFSIVIDDFDGKKNEPVF